MIDSTNKWYVTATDSCWLCHKTFSDGSKKSYEFQTQEWAWACKRAMDRFDDFERERMWGTNIVNFSSMGVTSSLNWRPSTTFTVGGKTLFAMDDKQQVLKFDVPAMIVLWLKTTWITLIPKVWKRLMWGERGGAA